MSVIIPYIFIVAYPDYKRPHTGTILGSCEKRDLEFTLDEKLVDIMIEMCDEKLNEFDDLREYVYSEYYMDQPPIEIMYFDTERNEWIFYDFDENKIIDSYNKKIIE